MTIEAPADSQRGRAIQQAAIAGEHFVAGELSKRGWIATLTAKNTPAVDILASRPGGGPYIQIDVKSRRPASPQGWMVGRGIYLTGRRDFIVLVGLGRDDQAPRYWIVPARRAAELVVRGAGRPWDNKLYARDVEEYKDAWKLLERAAR